MYEVTPKGGGLFDLVKYLVCREVAPKSDLRPRCAQIGLDHVGSDKSPAAAWHRPPNLGVERSALDEVTTG